jgi:hypothetical protein
MGFTSYDDLIAEITAGKRLIVPWQKNASTAGVAGNWYHMWPVSGQPGAGSYAGTSLQFVRTTDATTGAMYHGGNKAADTKHLIYMWGLASAGSPPPVFMLVDQVGYYPLTQSASQQVFDNTNGPDRYISGSQSGLQAVLVGTAGGGATASNINTLTYVNQAGATGHTMPTSPAVAVTVSAAAPTVNLGSRVLTTMGGAFIPLQAGDCGINSLTNVTFSAANTGAEAFLMVRPLAILPCPTANVPAERDLAMQIANLERVYDAACLTWLVYFPAATGATLVGEVDVAWG